MAPSHQVPPAIKWQGDSWFRARDSLTFADGGGGVSQLLEVRGEHRELRRHRQRRARGAVRVVCPHPTPRTDRLSDRQCQAEAGLGGVGRTDAGVGDVAPGEHGRARGAADGLDVVVAAAPARTALSAHGPAAARGEPGGKGAGGWGSDLRMTPACARASMAGVGICSEPWKETSFHPRLQPRSARLATQGGGSGGRQEQRGAGGGRTRRRRRS